MSLNFNTSDLQFKKNKIVNHRDEYGAHEYIPKVEITTIFMKKCKIIKF